MWSFNNSLLSCYAFGYKVDLVMIHTTLLYCLFVSSRLLICHLGSASALIPFLTKGLATKRTTSRENYNRLSHNVVASDVRLGRTWRRLQYGVETSRSTSEATTSWDKRLYFSFEVLLTTMNNQNSFYDISAQLSNGLFTFRGCLFKNCREHFESVYWHNIDS